MGKFDIHSPASRPPGYYFQTNPVSIENLKKKSFSYYEGVRLLCGIRDDIVSAHTCERRI